MIPVSDFVARTLLVDLSMQPNREVYILRRNEGLLLQFVPRWPLIKTSPSAIVVLLLSSLFIVPGIYCSPWHSNINYPSRCVRSILPPEPCSVRYLCFAGHGGAFGEISEVFRQHSKLSRPACCTSGLTIDESSSTTRPCCISTHSSATNG